MKVKELIEALQKMPQDLEVYGETFDGEAKKLNFPSFIYFNQHEVLLDDFSHREACIGRYKFKAVLL